MYQEVIQAIMDSLWLVLAVYGILVIRKWHRVAEKTDAALDELKETLKDGDT